MDVFENQFVDMESIAKSKNIIEENNSPFQSPTKSAKKRNYSSPKRGDATQGSMGASLQGSMTKEDARRLRREERKRELEEFERQEREAPKQYSLV